MTTKEEERDEERWLRDATLPQWTKRNLESHLSFGWEMFGCKNSSVLSFVIDHIGLMTRLRDHMNNALKNVHGVTSPIERQQKFNSLWEEEVDPIVASTLNSIEDFLEASDLRNASIAILCCLAVFCDGEVLGPVFSIWYAPDCYDDSQRLAYFVIPKFQEVWRKYDAAAAATALKLSQNQSGSHWFFNALKSGSVYAPNNASGK